MIFFFPNTKTNTWQLFVKSVQDKFGGREKEVDVNNVFECLCFANPSNSLPSSIYGMQTFSYLSKCHFN